MDAARPKTVTSYPRLHRLRLSQHYAKQVTQELVQKSMTLDALPHVGRVVPELNEKTVREVSLYSYRIIYQIQPTRIDILAIIHKRRDLKAGDIAL
jgi:toxin ParE1/3/4